MALGKFLQGKSVTVFVASKDRYGRSLGTVFANNQNANHWMVANGWAWHYKRYSNDQTLARLEKDARSKKLGLWATPHPSPPWEFRSLKKQTRAIKEGSATAIGYWLNTSSNTRHNSTCQWYKKTKRGRSCHSKEGKACGICGG
ncbi:thermonuclease family protein [Rubritalea tangerina]|uniref:thermonuclease family protein n=1 Tax=Rubritalea tangerina TaxID=430798 RepID=UPI0036207F3E